MKLFLRSTTRFGLSLVVTAGGLSLASAHAGCDDSNLNFNYGGLSGDCAFILDNGYCGNALASSHCPVTCEACEEYGCEDSQLPFVYADGNTYECSDIPEDRTDYFCSFDDVPETCSGACDFCPQPTAQPTYPPADQPSMMAAMGVQVNYGIVQVVACPGDDVDVTWAGTHDIQESVTSDCDSEGIGDPIVDYQDPGTVITFEDDELTAESGTTRYFRCSAHCQYAHFEVSCPM